MRFLFRLIVTATALWVAVRVVPGIAYSGPWAGLLGVGLVFGVINAFVRPVLFFLSLPLVFLSLGLFVLVLNALMLLLTSALAIGLGFEFTVAGFWPAFFGALVVGLVSTVLSASLGESKKGGRD